MTTNEFICPDCKAAEILTNVRAMLVPDVDWHALLIESSDIVSAPERIAEWDSETREAFVSFDGVLMQYIQDVLCHFGHRVKSEQEAAAWRAADLAARSILCGDATLDDIDAVIEQTAERRSEMLASGTSLLSLPTSSSLRRFRNLVTQMLDISYAQPAAAA